MDAHKGRDVATFDTRGSYLHTEKYENVIMLLEGSLSEMMAKVSPKIYQKYVVMSIKLKPLLYVQIQKALCGLLWSALIFYRNMVKYLEAYGFQINPYNPCASKNMINHKHMKVLWHVDELKVSRVYSFEVTKCAGYLSSIYGGISMHRGEIHNDLVIDLN